MRTPIILTYHQINDVPPDQDPYGISVTPAAFDQQMRYLKEKNFSVLHISEAVKIMRVRGKLPKKAVSITFDDGYRDNFENALPVLRKYGFPATIYLVAQRVGDYARWDGVLGARRPLMDWCEIKAMRPHNIEFGSHTSTHVQLFLESSRNAEKEIRGSKDIIEDALNSAVDTFAYPYEQVDRGLQKIVDEAGYSAARGIHRMRETYYNLWGTEVGRKDADLRSFERKLSVRQKVVNRLKLAARPITSLLK